MAGVWKEDEESPELKLAEKEWRKTEDDMLTAGFRDGAGRDYESSFKMGFNFGFKQGLQYGLHRGWIKERAVASGSQVTEEAAFRDEELSRKKAMKDFKAHLESCDIESLARMNEADNESELIVKNFVSQEAMHAACKDK